MTKHLVFLPCSIYGVKCGSFKGVVKRSRGVEEASNASCCYYILKVESDCSSQIENNDFETIGDCQEDGNSLILRLLNSNIRGEQLKIRLTNDNFEVCSSFFDDASSVVVLIYDGEVFKESELLLLENVGTVNSDDHFKVLASLLCQQDCIKVTLFWRCLTVLLTFLLLMAEALLKIVLFATPVSQYSALGSRLFAFLDTLVWALKAMKRQNKVSLKVGNYILATIVDICAGILLLQFIEYIGFSSPLSNHLLQIAKDVVHSLHFLLQWLSGSPAGLKLNGPYNLMMGRFFMYHINLWWVFLSVAQPVLEFLFTIFLGLGRLGVTFQAAILSDLLALVSFHIYCIYVYAARVYYLQLLGLCALWRLFLGRKHNPLRKRVDSCQYSPDQLFVGTLAFTILLFLLPTTLMYYIVFTMMRLILLGLSGILTQACFIFHALPIFATAHWIFGSKTVCNSVHLTPKQGQKDNPVVLFVMPVVDSWWSTIKSCVPDTVVCPPYVQFGQLVHKLTFGELVYPV